MDKNTLYGLILMALVFCAFMWMSPKDDPKGAQETTNTEKAEATAPSTADNLTDQELGWLRENINEHGQAVTLTDGINAMAINDSTVSLTVAGDSIFGTVRVGDKTLNWDDIRRADLHKMTVAEQRRAIDAVRQLSTSMGRYGKFARFLKGTDKSISLSNDVLALTLSSKSGSITRAQLKKYNTEYNPDETKNEQKPVVIFEEGTNSFNFLMPLPQSVETADLYFTPRQVNDSTVRMTLDVADNAYWGFEYVLPHGDSYLVRVKIIQKGMAQVVQSNNKILGLKWTQKLKRQEKGRMFEERQSGLFYKFAGGSVENLSESKNDSEERQAKIRWIGFKNQFFSSVLIADRPFNNADLSSEVLKGSTFLKDFDADATVNDYDWNSSNPVNFSLFLGPNSYPLLSGIDDKANAGEDLNLTKLIPLGWSIFRWINTLVIIPIFDFLGKYISNYGIIILLLTIFIKIVLFPLTYKSYKSQAKMRILAPDIKSINDKYPGQENALKRQQKTMELYSKAGASPMSGCLPMLLQMPILFAMFSFFPSCIELRGQHFLWAHDLSAPDAIISWSGNIPFITEYFGNHISLFCLLMTATNIIYTYINMQNSPQSMPGMKWMMYLMPLFFLVFFNNYAAGLSYYYFLSLLITIIQTYAVRHFIKEEDVRAAMAKAAKKPKKKSGFMARLEEMQRQQQQMLKEQQKQRGR
ncbi:MAG: membrane protein insertase YidC [Clostridium sp.]|nr:membrane protein insertase YidC [Prevotella sp.]MCM1429135.1 membrane protein insertase YidC [Clostridium sp.]MCM1475337.1 membrane protein insertase YidC [Muribaculaceae bacterium]